MTRHPEAPEVWGAAEAAAHLGVKQNNLRVLAGLPDPIQKIRASTLWLADDIRRFADERDAKAKAGRGA